MFIFSTEIFSSLTLLKKLDTLIKKPTRDSKNHIDNRTLNDFNSKKYNWHTLPPHLVRMGMMELQEWRELNDEK